MTKKYKSERITCPNHEWRLFQRDGVYYADGRNHANGKHSLGTRDRRKAIQELLELDASCGLSPTILKSDGAVRSDANRQPIGIEEGWDRYVENRSLPAHLGGLRESSKRKYGSHKTNLVEYCALHGIEYWHQINKPVLQQYAASLDKRLAPRTIHNDITMQISVANWLIEEKSIPADCKINWKLRKPERANRHCYTRKEVSRMLEYSASDPTLQWLYRVITMLCQTGLRVSEAANLRWSDIDMVSNVIHVRDESYSTVSSGNRRLVKDGESRIVPMHPDLAAFMAAVPDKTGFVLRGAKGRKLHVNHARECFVNKIINPLKDEFPSLENEVGFKDARFHSFRHFFVSECFAAGIPECDIKDWVGHSDSKVVELYRHVRSESSKANIKRGNFGAQPNNQTCQPADT